MGHMGAYKEATGAPTKAYTGTTGTYRRSTRGAYKGGLQGRLHGGLQGPTWEPQGDHKGAFCEGKTER